MSDLGIKIHDQNIYKMKTNMEERCHKYQNLNPNATSTDLGA
jgi:hypothetical protein